MTDVVLTYSPATQQALNTPPPKPTLCPRHATVHALLRAALGNAHHGHRTAHRTMTAISKQCPSCGRESTDRRGPS